jgi:hypothetical protein
MWKQKVGHLVSKRPTRTYLKSREIGRFVLEKEQEALDRTLKDNLHVRIPRDIGQDPLRRKD